MSRTAINKLSESNIHAYCGSVGITFVDDEYRSSSYLHQWLCGRCGQTVIQRLDKIKRANGKLRCCSRISSNNINKGHEIADKWNLIFKELTFKNSQHKNEWECPIHGTFNYALFTALQIDISPCKKCSNGIKQKNLADELLSLYAKVPHIKLLDPEIKTRRSSHNWYCSLHDYTTTSNLELLNKTLRLKCCRAKEYSGTNHPFYNSDIPDDKRIKKRHYNATNNWSKRVRERDGWKCVICGYNQKCVAHHLDSYLAFPNKRYDVNNGVTLCRPHHIDFHKKYGTTRTTRSQFEEYIKFLQN